VAVVIAVAHVAGERCVAVVAVIASEAKQSSRAPQVRQRKCAAWRGLTLDCFASLAMTGEAVRCR
jgi:hypothetical protein